MLAQLNQMGKISDAMLLEVLRRGEILPDNINIEEELLDLPDNSDLEEVEQPEAEESETDTMNESEVE